MENIDINNLIVKDVKAPNKKMMTGSITFCSINDDKSKALFPLDHKCYSHSLILLGQPVTATYNPNRRVIVSVRQP